MFEETVLLRLHADVSSIVKELTAYGGKECALAFT